MAGASKAEHVSLRVPDLERAERFYADAFGLATVAREDEAVYLGCGFDENFDLALSEGAPGVEHVAVRAGDAERVALYEERLDERGLDPVRTDGDEPGQEVGVRVELPSGLPIELVTVADKSYKHFYEAALDDRGGLAPLDLDHYNYHSPDVEADARLLCDVLDFTPSAVIADWQAGAFLRRGDRHHDVAVFSHGAGPDDRASHHHTGFTVSSVDHMVKLLDRLTMHDTPLEFGIGRHFGGDNVFAYVRAPDGHRIELVTEMTELDDDTPVQNVSDVNRAVSAWHDDVTIPESWLETSGLAE